MNDKVKLNLLLNEFLTAKINFVSFESNFHNTFIESDYIFQSNDEELFGDICEKLDFTSTNHKEVKTDKKYGWITDIEFKTWLKEKINL